MKAKFHRLLIFGSKAILHNAGPYSACRSKFCNLFEKVIVHIEKETKALSKDIDVKADFNRSLYISDGIGQGEGDFLNGRIHGRGTRTFSGGGSYEGEWRDDLPNGSGTRYTADGQSFYGHWQNGCFREGTRWATVGTTARQCGFQ